MHRTTIVAASVAILLALPVWGQDKPRNSDIENIGRRDVSQGAVQNVYSIDKEIAMGRQLSALYEKQVRLSNDPELGEYINRLGQNIVLNSDVRNLPVTFRVVESDEKRSNHQICSPQQQHQLGCGHCHAGIHCVRECRYEPEGTLKNLQ